MGSTGVDILLNTVMSAEDQNSGNVTPVNRIHPQELGIESHESPTKVNIMLSHDELAQLIANISSSVVGEIKNQMTTVIGDVMNNIRDQLSHDFAEIRQSVTSLKSTGDAFNVKHCKDIAAVHSRINAVETSARNKVDAVSRRIDSMLSTMEELKAQIRSSQQRAASVSGNHSLSECLAEVEDRLSRKQNVMMFGVPESQGIEYSQRQSDDINYLGHVFSDLNFSEPLDAITCYRLGKYSPNLTHPRPLKVVMSSSKKASSLIQTSRLKKDLPFATPIMKQTLILPDQSVLQRQQVKELKLELVRRRKYENNPNLRIATRNGVSRIVTSSSRSSQRS